jgi:hypothetical protein
MQWSTFVLLTSFLHLFSKDNIGFDVRGDAKLFDFGLATEFDVAKHGSYKLTGDTGTIR